MSKNIEISKLGHTWIFDIDGTLVKHNGYKLDGIDTLLPGVADFFEKNLRDEDYVLLLTARKSEFKELTEKFLKENNIRFDKIIYDLPMGERIVVNDRKPSGLEMSVAINTNRDEFIKDTIVINEEL